MDIAQSIPELSTVSPEILKILTYAIQHAQQVAFRKKQGARETFENANDAANEADHQEAMAQMDASPTQGATPKHPGPPPPRVRDGEQATSSARVAPY